MARDDSKALTTEQAKKDMNRNPTGKGGFQDHPELRNPGGRPKNAESFTYWYQQFKNMTVSELKSWQQDNPEDTRTVAAHLAYTRVFKSEKNLKEFQEVADRSEGKPSQKVEVDNNIDPITLILQQFNIISKDGKPKVTQKTSSEDQT